MNSDGILTAGSIEGAGTFDMGGNMLRVGSNNLSTTVSGTIDGPYGTGLIKVGTGTLTPSGDNNFNGAITIDGGAVDLASINADVGSGIVFGPNAPETLRIEDAALRGRRQ